jgi:ATP-dependent 26S proteasome regulatory subunit
VIGATNRKSDLDPALLSRFDMSILFDLPDEKSRALILGQYAQQLKVGGWVGRTTTVAKMGWIGAGMLYV